MWRSMFHLDNAYKLPAVEVVGRVCRTHKTSQTAFRGFGGPQGMLVIEEVLGLAAQKLNLPADVVRQRNFYREGDDTHYGERVRDAGRIETIWNRLKAASDYENRRAHIDAFNARSPHAKRGLAMTPVKFGISFTATFFNQAGAVVLVYRDGTVQVNHGGTEMGQGLFTKILQVAAETLGVPISHVRVMPTRTDKVPNTSATAASSGSDLNGAAVEDACVQIRARLAAVAASQLECESSEVRFEGGVVLVRGRSIEFGTLCEIAYKQRVPLFAEGFYRTPDIHFDHKTGRGRPFHYYAYGAAASEIEVDGFTGQYRLLRTDILHDAGDSISPVVDRGQIEGGYLQGVGWLTIEELLWDDTGRVSTAGASTYKLPSWSEVPEIFNVHMLERATEPGVVMGSKAVGEPPLMLAFSVREAIREAIAAFGRGHIVSFDSPATPERVFFAVRQARQLELTALR
jgi:xanthine dehydrogenase large subunit